MDKYDEIIVINVIDDLILMQLVTESYLTDALDNVLICQKKRWDLLHFLYCNSNAF